MEKENWSKIITPTQSLIKIDFKTLWRYRDLIHSELESKLEVLLSKSGSGIVDFAYSSSSDNFDSITNANYVGNSIMKILNSPNVVWN